MRLGSFQILSQATFCSAGDGQARSVSGRRAVMLSVVGGLAMAFALTTGPMAGAQGGGPGGGSHAPGTHIGDVFGDLVHIKRDPTTGQPILQKRWVLLPADVYGWDYCPIPVDALGLEIPFLPDSCDPDPVYTDAIIPLDYFGRLSGGRTKEQNQRMHFDEIISTIKSSEIVDLDEAGRLRIGADCTPAGACTTWRTIDSPMENLSLYRRVMKYGHLQTDPLEVDTSMGGDPAAGTVYHPALDDTDWVKFAPPLDVLLPRASSGQCFPGAVFDPACALPTSLTTVDFVLAGFFLAGAADKTGKITVDLVQYMNRILKITEVTPGSLATLNTLPALIRDDTGAITPAPAGLPWPASELFVDFSPAAYLRSDWFSRSTTLLQTTDGFTFQPTSVDLMTWLDFINGPRPAGTTSLEAFVASSSDALRIVQFVHEYAVPTDLWAGPVATTTVVTPATVGYSSVDQGVTLTAAVSSANSSPVDSGDVTFVVQTAAAVAVGVPVTAPVAAGTATGTFTLPGGTTPQVLTVTAVFTPSGVFGTSQGVSTLTVTPAPTLTTVASASVPASPAPQDATLSATVTAQPADVVNEGTLLFTLLDSGGTVVGVPVSTTVVGGAATALYTVPGGLAVQRLTIVGDYQGTALYDPSTGSNLLAVGCVPITIQPATLPAATLGQAYSVTFTSDGIPPDTFSLGSAAPPGLDLSGAVLSGVPTAIGTYWITIDVVDATGCTGSQAFQLDVNAAVAMVTGSGSGIPALVHLLDINGLPPAGYPGPTDLTPFPGLTTGVRVAQGDVTGDGMPDTVVGAGPGGGPHVQVYDGATGALIQDFWAFDYYSGGGVYVAVGDIDGDGVGDIAVSQGHGPPSVRVFSGTDLSMLRDLTLSGIGPCGLRVAMGDADADGYDDLFVAAGPDTAPVVQVISGATGALLQTVMVFASGVTSGVFIAAGDLDADGYDDIIAGAGDGSASMVRVLDVATLTELRAFTAFDPAFLGGARVASVDLNGDGAAEIITAAGPGGAPEVRVFDGQTGALLSAFLAYPSSLTGGVYVGAGR